MTRPPDLAAAHGRRVHGHAAPAFWQCPRISRPESTCYLAQAAGNALRGWCRARRTRVNRCSGTKRPFCTLPTNTPACRQSCSGIKQNAAAMHHGRAVRRQLLLKNVWAGGLCPRPAVALVALHRLRRHGCFLAVAGTGAFGSLPPLLPLLLFLLCGSSQPEPPLGRIGSGLAARQALTRPGNKCPSPP